MASCLSSCSIYSFWEIFHSDASCYWPSDLSFCLASDVFVIYFWIGARLYVSKADARTGVWSRVRCIGWKSIFRAAANVLVS